MLGKLKNILKRKFRKSIYERYPQYQIGRGTYGNPKVHIWEGGAALEIGAFCSIASGVQIFLGGEHRTDWVTTYPFSKLWKAGQQIKGHPTTKGNVIIGNDVWIGTEAVIMSGVHIGDGAVIGARSVVTKDVPPYSIAAGNPTRIVKKRFDNVVISRLLELKWWNWDDVKIEKYLPMLLNDRIDVFLEAAESDITR